MATLVNHRYELVRPLGAGQHASVWLAKDKRAGDQERALKFVRVQDHKQQLIGEFEQLSSLSHTGLARVFAIEKSTASSAATGSRGAMEGDLAGALFIVSEFVGGASSTEHARRNPGDAMLLTVCEQVASAVSYLHARSLVHADIKPDNLRWADPQRIVLLDLGLSRQTGRGEARGSPRYMAPEAFAGYLDARSDLYSLGATLFELACGRPLFDAEESGPLISSILAGRSRDAVADSLPGDLAPALRDLVAMLVAPDPSQRPSGARALLAHLARVREAAGIPAASATHSASPNFARPEFVGRAEELAQLREALRKFDGSSMGARRIVIAGPKGSGRRRLVEEAHLHDQIDRVRSARTTLPAHIGSREELWPQRASISADGPALMVLCDDGDPNLVELITAPAPENILLILSLDSDRVGGATLPEASVILPPLSARETASLCRGLALISCSEHFCKRAHELTRGWPGAIRDLMSAAATLDPACSLSPDVLLREDNLAANLVQRVASLSSPAGLVLEQLAVVERPIALSQLQGLLDLDADELPNSVAELVAAGFVSLQGGLLCCLSTEQARLIDAHLPAARRRGLHRRCLQLLPDTLHPADRARHLLVAGPVGEANKAVLAAIVDRRAAGRLDQALQLCLAAKDQVTCKASSLHAAHTAEIALASGDYQLALTFANRARRSRDAAIRTRGLRALARSSQHLGKALDAARYFSDLLAVNPHDTESRARLAKNLLLRGELVSACDEARRALDESADLPTQAIALEVIGLAQLYRGEVASAAERFAELTRRCQQQQDGALLGRARGLQGMCAQKQGMLAEAAGFYGEAHSHSARSGAWHAAAVFLLNRATVEQRRANYALALDSLSAALPGLTHSGTPFELAAAHCNRGYLLLVLGELEAAKAAAAQAQDLASRASEPRIQFFTTLLDGDLSAREGDLDAARHSFRAAFQLAEQHSLADALHAELRILEARAAGGESGSSELLRRRHSDSREQEAEALASQARVHLAVGTPSAELADELATLQEALCKSDDLDLGWRVAVLQAQIRHALGQGAELATAVAAADALFSTVLLRSPEAYRKGLRNHPDAQALATLHARGVRAPSDDSAASDFPTRSLLSLSRRLNSELRLEPLLDDIIDAAVELSRAERAFLLLRTPGGELDIRVARNIDREDLGADARLSRSIAERVAQSGQAVMTVDAESDTRFGASLSVAALRLRSILAVPFRVKNRVVGTLYLDHRFRRGAFDDSAVELVRELADIAAVAIENARLVTENQRRQKENEELTARLERSLEDTEAQLVTARAQLPSDRPQKGFASIIGESKALRDVLATAERAASSDVSVVIAGESGTGKELLARAIHQSSKRSAQPFVALNCGAVPDNLLESELFGHRKGAFTGADRGRRGLFQVADGGTLFLDEIADTSLAMQSKLLRALQEGEIRPLGAEDSSFVDVRIICASNRPLASLVEDGSFREDLFYRLHVMSLTLPPLRERIADIEALTHHILGKLGHEDGISPATIATLQAHRWPGNVRELENELTRACAMADSGVMQPQHLSESLQVLQDLRTAPSSDNLLLKPRVERLERSLVEEAMRQTGGNQSKAAVLLGLSRYGLQKKLLRYGIAGSQK